MKAVILGVLGIPVCFVVVLMATYYDSIRNDLQSGFKRSRRREKESSDSNGNQNPFSSKDNDFNHWDVSGGMLGI
jgi:hypothetical protein